MEELSGRAAVYARRAEIVRLRRAGRSWTRIARAVGYDNKGAACRDYQRATALDVPAALAAAEQLRNLAEVLAGTTGSDEL
jgi:hypothetical protein